MHLRKLGLLATVAAMVASVGTAASAADLGARPAFRPPLPPPAYNWTGFYVGGHFGGGWARESWEEHTPFPGGFGSVCHDFQKKERESDLSVLNSEGGSIFNPPLSSLFPVCPFDTLNQLSGLGQTPAVGSHNAIGPLGGFQAGFNWQAPGSFWVIGVEGQFSFASLKGDHGNSISADSTQGIFFDGVPFPIATINTQGQINDRFFSKVKDIATLAVRAGITSDAIVPTLFYVKGGAAYKKTDYNVTSQFSATSCGIILTLVTLCDTTNGAGAWSGSENRWGWMAGVGLEFALFSNWTAKIEYDYLGFKRKDVTLAGGVTANCTGFICGFPNQPREGFPSGQTQSVPFSRTFSIDENVQLIKLGLNYRFGYAAPVAAPMFTK